MLKKLFQSFRSPKRRTQQLRSTPEVLNSSQHSLQRAQFSRYAVNIVERLQNAGYQAYLVGGCVRDMLLNITPKDFDVATSATPEQVRAEFRNARIIGRRFKLVHIHFGREIIEVATFRANHPQNDEEEDSNQSSRNESGRILRDNVYGTLEEDAQRRDFTINALYYDPVSERILDYANGVHDIRNRLLRLIGDFVDQHFDVHANFHLQAGSADGLLVGHEAVPAYFCRCCPRTTGSWDLCTDLYRRTDASESDVEASLDRLNRWNNNRNGEDPVAIRKALQECMQHNFSVFREGDAMAKGLEQLKVIRERLKNARLDDTSSEFNTQRVECLELDNLMETAYATAVSANFRTESRGAHSRFDFPDRDDENWLCHSLYLPESESMTRRSVNMEPKLRPAFPPKIRTY